MTLSRFFSIELALYYDDIFIFLGRKDKMLNKKAIRTSAVLIILIFAIFRFIAEPFRLSGDCMEPAFRDGELYFLNRISSYVRPYQLRDVILFKHEDKVWISRIVALGGDVILLDDDKVILNGTESNDTNIQRDWTDWIYGTYGINHPVQVPLGHVYVLSDKLSAHHDDSRVFGPIPEASILGILW